MDILALYIVTGAFVGFIAGLFGVGGGLIIVPVLVFIFIGSAAHFAPAIVMPLAIGTSLATIVVTSLSSVRAHHLHGAVLWPVVGRLAPGIVVGALAAAAIIDHLPGDSLRIIFGVFELLVAALMGFGISAAPHRQLPGWGGTSIAGTVIGAVSGVVGIGGGTLTVPFLVWCNVGMRQAVASSAACGLSIALAGTLGFMMAGWSETRSLPWSSGYVYWPAFAGIALTSVLCAPVGAKLAHSLPTATLKRFFALFLAFLGIRMLLM